MKSLGAARGTGPGWWRITTLRARIAIWYGAIITVCLLTYSLAVGTSFTRQVQRELDHRLHEDVELAARALVTDSHGNPSWPGAFMGRQVAEEDGGGHWIEVWEENGHRHLVAGTFDPKIPGGNPSRASGPTTVRTAFGPVRVTAEPLVIDGRRFLIRAAVSEQGTRQRIQTVWLQLWSISFLVLVVGGFGGIAISHRLLGPLVRVADHARRITAEQLHERLDAGSAGEELELLAASFNVTLARLEESFAQLRRFTADASHEIRTPLTALRSVGEVALQRTKSNEEYREVIGTMLEEVDRLSRLADELLTIARTEAGQAHYHVEPVDLVKLAEEVVEQLEVLAEERGQSLVVRADGDVQASGDRLALRQALMNLVDNAIKYAPEGSAVTVTVAAGSNAATIEVHDEGPGIAPEHLDRIFERFYRIDPSRSRHMGGTGLGLSLVKLTALAHGGDVVAESEPGRGSTFRLRLPRPAAS